MLPILKSVGGQAGDVARGAMRELSLAPVDRKPFERAQLHGTPIGETVEQSLCVNGCISFPVLSTGKAGHSGGACCARRAIVKEALACRPELLFGIWDRRCLRLSCVNQPSNVSTLTTVSRSQGVKVSFSTAFLAPPRGGCPPQGFLRSGRTRASIRNVLPCHGPRSVGTRCLSLICNQ